MRRPRADDEAALSLDSFLDIVTNVVGMLILVAVVTVLGARNVAVSAGPTVLTRPPPTATRLLVECAADQAFVVDEEAHAKRIQAAVRGRAGSSDPPSVDDVEAALREKDVGDEQYRVGLRVLGEGVAWDYERRGDAKGTRSAEIDAGESRLHRALDALEPGGFVYFAVREDGFEVFRRARDLAVARGFSVGWHPIEGQSPLRLAAGGSLGKRVQ